jgi:hypothetical protein
MLVSWIARNAVVPKCLAANHLHWGFSGITTYETEREG